MRSVLAMTALTAAMLAGYATTSRADANAAPIGDDEGGGGRPPRPPQEAIDACENLSEGASCSFTGHGHTMTGTCHGPEGLPSACMPNGGPPPPPQEAIDACQSSTSGASCSFTLDGQSMTGACRAPQGKPLACVPKGMPPPPQR
jgi:hypothetical protein